MTDASRRPKAPPDLATRLLRFLAREEEDERRSALELRASSVDDRVLEGECIRDAEFIGAEGDALVFRATENLSKFRAGDTVAVGDGVDFDAARPVLYGSHDQRSGRLVLQRDRFSRGELPRLEEGRRYVVDRRPLGLRGRLQDVVRAGFADERIAAVLAGRHRVERDDERHSRAVEALAARGLDESQVAAGAAAIATESLALVQGPPGTGKTRLLAELLRALCGAGCRIALSAFTHRGVDNLLFALRRLAPGVEVVKFGNAGSDAARLRRAGVGIEGYRNPRLPEVGVVAGTAFALARLPASAGFHFAVFDEAGQMPVPHAIAGMLLARRWLLFGDHEQLPPVVKADHADREVTRSVFEHLHGLYGSSLLRTTYRMNAGLCAVIGETFYDGRLCAAPAAAARRLAFRPGGALDEVLDPERPAVLVRVDHRHPGHRSAEEAELCAELVDELVGRHRVPPQEIAVVAPFRAQVRAIRAALQQRHADAPELVVDTVERIQGQEREVVIVSLTVGDASALDARASFFFSTNRLNVALSRARTKAVLIGAAGAFRALPQDADALLAASAFKRLARVLPTVDLTDRYRSEAARA